VVFSRVNLERFLFVVLLYFAAAAASLAHHHSRLVVFLYKVAPLGTNLELDRYIAVSSEDKNLWLFFMPLPVICLVL
jgi:hypothetical protein